MKKRYSYFPSTVILENNILTIVPKRVLTASLLIIFLIGILYLIFFTEFILLMKISASIGGIIIVWAIWEVLFMRMILKLDVSSQFFSLEKTSMKNTLFFRGKAQEYLSVKLRKAPRTQFAPEKYSILLVFENNETEVPFLLEIFAYSISEAERKKNIGKRSFH